MAAEGLPMRGTYSERFENAFVYAYQLHARQTRKGGDVPYISHLMAVCGLVMEHGGDEDQAIAALLHDAVEDQGGQPTADEIERRFGSNVRRIVEGCTDTDQTPKPPWRKRKEDYIAHLRNAPLEVRLVSCCDKIHNARTILTDFRKEGEGVWSRFQVGPEQHLWYYRSLIEVFQQCGGLTNVVTELERVIWALEAEISRDSATA